MRSRVVSNLFFIATFYKHKPLIFLEKVRGLWFFLWLKKRPYRPNVGLTVFFTVVLQTQLLGGFRIGMWAFMLVKWAAFGQIWSMRRLRKQGGFILHRIVRNSSAYPDCVK